MARPIHLPPDQAGERGLQDPALCDRVTDVISAFQRSFHAAVADPNSTNGDRLREATDRLMRAGARVLMELDRS